MEGDIFVTGNTVIDAMAYTVRGEQFVSDELRQVDFSRRVIAMTAGRVVADGPTFEVLRDGRVLKEAHILPPQVTEVSLILGREAACPAAVAEANTVAQMVTAVAQACDREVEDVEVEAID